jgi:hypothetical protein
MSATIGEPAHCPVTRSKPSQKVPGKIIFAHLNAVMPGIPPRSLRETVRPDQGNPTARRVTAPALINNKSVPDPSVSVRA